MRKILLGLVLLTAVIVAEGTIEELKNFKIPTKESLKDIKNNFSKLNKTDIDVKKYGKLLDKSTGMIDLDKQLKDSLKQYKGDDFMTKEEYSQVVSAVVKAREVMKEDMISEYIIYLTSETVPDSAYMDILHSVGILQENGAKIKTKQYLIGIPKDFKKYMFDKRDYMMKMTEKEQKYILKNFAIKIDPRMFEMFEVKKVPAIIYGICSGKNPGKDNCKFTYMIRGDSSLTNFFERISDEDPRYKKYWEYLIGNKIVNKQLKKEIKK